MAVINMGGKILKLLRPRLEACNPIVALINCQSTIIPPSKMSPRLSKELLLPLLPLQQRQTSTTTMPPSFPTPNTFFLEDTKEPIPSLFSPVDEDIYPFAKPRPLFPHQPTSNTIAPENAPEDNLGLHYFSIYYTALICGSRFILGRHALSGRHRIHAGVALDILGRSSKSTRHTDEQRCRKGCHGQSSGHHILHNTPWQYRQSDRQHPLFLRYHSFFPGIGREKRSYCLRRFHAIGAEVSKMALAHERP